MVDYVAPGMIDSTAGSLGFRNRIHNGDFRVWQRGTSAAMTTGSIVADRWFHNMYPTANGTISQSTTGVAGLPYYCLKMQRTSSSSANGAPFVGQALETLNCLDLQGQVLTLSFYAKCGANFSASGSNMITAFWTGTGTDQTCQSGTGGGWTGYTAQLNYVSQVISTTWTRYYYSVTIPSNATQIGFQIGYSVTGTAGADDSIYFTGIQLEKGSVPTSFESRPVGLELALCQRYFYTSFAGRTAGSSPSFWYGTVDGLSVAGRTIYPVQMRTTPTVTLYSTSGASGNVRQWNNFDVPAFVFVNDPLGFQVQFTTGSRATNAFYPYDCTASAEL